MNSVSYIGTQVDTLLGRKEPPSKPKVALEKVTVWHILISVLLLRWTHVASILTTTEPQAQQAPSTTSTTSTTSSSAPAPIPEKKRRRKHSVVLKRSLAPRLARKTLVLDLDETLIHSISRSTRPYGAYGAHMVEVEVGKINCIYFVEKRPYCDLFLNTVREWFDLVIFTASVQTYADPMIDWLDQGRNYFSRRLYRPDCIAVRDGVRDGYVKDLTNVSSDLSKLILVDNSPISFERQHDNGIGIQGWIADPTDCCLLHLLPLLNALRHTSDVRSLLCLQHGDPK